MSRRDRPTDQLHRSMSAILRLGAGLAVILVGVGVLVSRLAPIPPPTADSFLGQLSGGGAASITSFGLLVLVLTPVATLAAAVVGFVRQGEGRYVVRAAVVLGLLLASLAGGLVIGLGGGG